MSPRRLKELPIRTGTPQVSFPEGQVKKVVFFPLGRGKLGKFLLGR